jgi:hypothetical protein
MTRVELFRTVMFSQVYSSIFFSLIQNNYKIIILRVKQLTLQTFQEVNPNRLV